MVEYPAFFAHPTWSYGEAISPFAGRTPMESGWTRQRKGWNQNYTSMTLQFKMSNIEYSYWMDWINANGYDWFEIRLDRFDADRPKREIRLKTPVTYAYQGFDYVIVEAEAEVYGELPNPDKIPPLLPGYKPKERACTSWTVGNTTAVCEDFWVSPTTTGASTFESRMDRDLVITCENDEVFIQHGIDIVHTTNFGESFTTTPFRDWLLFDSYWDQNEKASDSLWDKGAWPRESIGGPSRAGANSSLQTWKWRGGQLIYSALVANTSSNYACYLCNWHQNDIIFTGFAAEARWETVSNKGGYYNDPYVASYQARCFTWWDKEQDGSERLTRLGVSQENPHIDAYPSRMALQWGSGGTQETSAMLRDGTFAPYRLEDVNAFLIGYGNYALTGGSLFGYIEVKPTIEFGDQFTFGTEWNGVNWVRNTPKPVYQPDEFRIKQAGAAPYRQTNKQRLVKWRSQSLSQKMFAGLSGKDGTIYTNLDDGVQYDYTSELNWPGTSRVEVYPVNEKGAFVLVEFSDSGSFTQARMKLSATGLPGSFTEPVTFTLPLRYGSNTNRIGVEYSRSQAKFLITYFDNNSKTHVVTVEDTFSCAIWEDL